MTAPVAFRATYSDWKLVKTRQVVQIVFEVPLADADAAYDVIGGMPNPSSERWFGIAPLETPKQPAKEPAAQPRQDSPQVKPDGAKRPWCDVQPSAQAGIRCAEPIFWAFLNERHGQRVVNSDDAATAVRKLCKVNSRAHFNTNPDARFAWNTLDLGFQAWKEAERVGA